MDESANERFPYSETITQESIFPAQPPRDTEATLAVGEELDYTSNWQQRLAVSSVWCLLHRQAKFKNYRVVEVCTKVPESH